MEETYLIIKTSNRIRMSKTMLIVAGVVVLITAGIALMARDGASPDVMTKDINMTADGSTTTEGMMTDDEKMVVEDAGMTGTGSYEPYSSEKLARAEEGDVVLFFRAGWCPTCRAADADIRAHASDIPAGLTILDVNYDTATALKQKYGVTYQHTFVQVDSAGNQIAKWSGSPTLADVIARVQ